MLKKGVYADLQALPGSSLTITSCMMTPIDAIPATAKQVLVFFALSLHAVWRSIH
jgi:hypothetical protein